MYTLWATSGTPSAPNEVLVKENVSESVINLYPEYSPINQWCSTVPMSQPLREQPVDTLANITRTNAAMVLGSDTTVQQSGSAANYLTENYPHKIRGIAHIQQAAWSVSGTDRAVEMYGINDRFTYTSAHVAKKFLQDFNLRAHWARGTNVGGLTVSTSAGTVAAGGNRRQTQGLASWILTGGLERGKGLTANLWNTSGEVLRSSATLDYRTHAHDAQGVQLSEDMWNDQLMSPWYNLASTATGTKVAFMGAKCKFAFRTFALSALGAINQRTIPAENKRIVDDVQVYDTAFGPTFLHLNFYLNQPETTTYTLTDSASVVVPWDETILVFNPAYYHIGQVRPMEFSPLAKDGDRDNGMYTWEAGLLCDHPFGGAAITNCIAA